jgi:hypothetical protein
VVFLLRQGRTHRDSVIVSRTSRYQILVENSFQIALSRATGELGNPDVAWQVLLETVETMIMRGERRNLLLSNKAVDAYKRFRAERHLELVS